MEINRFNLNKTKTILNNGVNYILKVYESIEEECQYDAFISMCDNYLEYCQFWQKKFKPKFGKLSYTKYKLYLEYVEFAQYTLNKIQNLINQYNTTIQEAAEEEEYINTIRKKLTAEYFISKELQESNDELTKKKTPKIGFVTSASKKKRKYNKKKHDKEKLDNTNS